MMGIRMKPGQLERQGLAERMAATLPGQITWADLSSQKRCASCRFFAAQKGKPDGRCALVKAHTKKPGVIFNGSLARACTKFEGLQ